MKRRCYSDVTLEKSEFEKLENSVVYDVLSMND